jgi:hypothetical protein
VHASRTHFRAPLEQRVARRLGGAHGEDPATSVDRFRHGLP